MKTETLARQLVQKMRESWPNEGDEMIRDMIAGMIQSELDVPRDESWKVGAASKTKACGPIADASAYIPLTGNQHQDIGTLVSMASSAPVNLNDLLRIDKLWEVVADRAVKAENIEYIKHKTLMCGESGELFAGSHLPTVFKPFLRERKSHPFDFFRGFLAESAIRYGEIAATQFVAGGIRYKVASGMLREMCEAGYLKQTYSQTGWHGKWRPRWYAPTTRLYGVMGVQPPEVVKNDVHWERQQRTVALFLISHGVDGRSLADNYARYQERMFEIGNLEKISSPRFRKMCESLGCEIRKSIVTLPIGLKPGGAPQPRKTHRPKLPPPALADDFEDDLENL